eukprot:COSAG05_NODE_5040_length_1282_cov_0.915469_1_plen_343_part_00
MLLQLYACTPTAFLNGGKQNTQGENLKSLKIMSWSIQHGLQTHEALRLFGSAATPAEVADHPNIQQLAKTGLAGFWPAHWPLTPRTVRPVFYHVHGGGWCVYDGIDTWDSLNQTICDTVGCSVVYVDYRSAPEFPFPTPIEDCWHGLQWLVDPCVATSLGIDPSRLAVGGWSAGGNLAAALALLARDRRPQQEEHESASPKICFQLLGIPATDDDFETASYLANAEHYGLTRRSMMHMWELYATAADRASPYACPQKAESLVGLPTAFVQTMEFDPLRDDGFKYAQRLREAGVRTQHVNYEGCIHGAMNMRKEAPEVFVIVKDAMQALAGAFSTDISVSTAV